MNVKLLEQVRDYIKDHPTEYSQDKWCGTQRCIAGHAVVLAGLITERQVSLIADGKMQEKVREIAQKALDLDDYQAEALFVDWPEQFDAGWGSYGRAEAINAAVERINHFIKTGGEE